MSSIELKDSSGLARFGMIEGCPAGLNFSPDFLQTELDRRRPGQAAWVSARKKFLAVFIKIKLWAPRFV